MIYRGTQRVRSAHEVNLAFERLGGSLFASTQVDHGIFSLSLPPESLDEACALFGEVLAQPAFLDIDIERGIVLEEILEDLDDEGRQVDADNLSRALIYGTTRSGSPSRGPRGARARLRRGHRCAAGTQGTTPRETPSSSSRARSTRGRRCASREADFERLARGIAHRGDRLHNTRAEEAAPRDRRQRLEPDRAAHLLPRVRRDGSAAAPRSTSLMRIVDDGMSTRLYHRLCDARGLCYDVSAGYDGYEDDGVVDVAAGVQHKRAALVTREILAMFEELAHEGPTAEELDKARRRIVWDARTLADSAEETAAFYAGGLLFERFSTPEEHVAELVRVQAGDVREAARQLARPERLTAVAVGLLENGEDERLDDRGEGLAGRVTPFPNAALTPGHRAVLNAPEP